MPGSGWMVSVYPCKVLQHRSVAMQMGEKSVITFPNKPKREKSSIEGDGDNMSVGGTFPCYANVMEIT